MGVPTKLKLCFLIYLHHHNSKPQPCVAIDIGTSDSPQMPAVSTTAQSLLRFESNFLKKEIAFKVQIIPDLEV